MGNNKIVTIRTFNSESEAVIIKGVLDSAGINSSLTHQTIHNLLPLPGDVMRIELLVAAEDEEKARAIIGAKFDKEEFAMGGKAEAKPRKK